jgi:tRNA pseudouridine55 synthase
VTAESGLVVVDKPAGLTSHDVVARVRRLAGTRKVGHAGTLDPMATGVLVVGVGRATRLLGHLTLTEKRYDATVRLGASTTTDDADGEVVVEGDASRLSEEELLEALVAFRGEIEQVPSSVSAVKVAGKPAYQRVREGERVELAPRRVTIHELAVHDLGSPGPVRDLRISVRCSSGTYIRAVARDLGAALGVGGHLLALRRTSVGPFGLEAARSLEQLADSFDVVPMGDAARACFPAVDLTEDQAVDVRVGRPLALSLEAAGPVAVFDPDGAFLALYERRTADRAHPVAVFSG